MSKEVIEPLEPELARLFEAEAQFPAESTALKARVWEQVQLTVGPVPPGGGGEGSALVDGSAPAAATSVASAGLGKLAAVGFTASSPEALVAPGFIMSQFPCRSR